MKSRLRDSLALVTFYLLPGLASATEDLATQVDAVFAEYDSTRTPGCAVGVVRDGELVLERAYGMADLDRNVPVSTETVFMVASVSKQFTAAAIALLAGRGQLDVGDDVRKYVPELADYGHEITIEQLIHHTSGIRDHANLWALSGRSSSDAAPQEEVLALLARQRNLNFIPGEQHSYSNAGYFLLGVIVERVSQQSLGEFVAQNIFSPLGMRHSRHCATDRTSTPWADDTMDAIPGRALGYLRNREGTGFRQVRTSFDPIDSFGGSGVLTTVADLARWQANFDHDMLDERNGGLVARMLRRQPLKNGKENTYAYGLLVDKYRGLDVVMHSGGSGGYSAFVLRFPAPRVSVITLCNTGRIATGALSRKVADIYLSDRFPLPAETARSASTPDDEPMAPALDARLTAQYVGSYRSDELDATFRIWTEQGQLRARARYGVIRTLRPAGKDRFEYDGVNRLTFTRDGRGKVIGIEFNAERIRSLKAPKLPASAQVSAR